MCRRGLAPLTRQVQKQPAARSQVVSPCPAPPGIGEGHGWGLCAPGRWPVLPSCLSHTGHSPINVAYLWLLSAATVPHTEGWPLVTHRSLPSADRGQRPKIPCQLKEVRRVQRGAVQRPEAALASL